MELLSVKRLVATVVVAACAVGAATTGAMSAITKNDAANGGVRVGIVLPGIDNYYGVVLKAAKKEAAKKGITLVTGAGNFVDPPAEIAAVQNILTQNIKILVIAPMGPLLKPILERARSQGVKLVFIDQQIPGWNKMETYIGTDNPTASAAIGKWLVKKLGGKGEVGIDIGVPGLPVLEQRYQNAVKVLKRAGIKVDLMSQATDCEVSKAVPVVKTFLVSHPNVNAIYSVCGPSAIGADKVVSERPGGKGKTITVGFDVETGQIQDILAGRADAAMAQFPVKLGQKGIDEAIAVSNGVHPPKRINNPTMLVTKANAHLFYAKGNTYSYLIGS